MCKVVAFDKIKLWLNSVYFRDMASVLGKNVLVGCEHFSLPVDKLLSGNFSPQIVEHISIGRRDIVSYHRAACLLELIMLKRGVLYTARHSHLCHSDIDVAVSSLCNAWC